MPDLKVLISIFHLSMKANLVEHVTAKKTNFCL